MGAVTGALRSAAEAAGAQVRLEAPVERVLVDDEARAAGVVLEGGEELRARAVLSNADPVRTASAGRRRDAARAGARRGRWSR